MYRLLRFIRKYYVLLLFILLEAVVISHYAKSNSYSGAKILTASNKAVGGVHNVFASIGDYFTLGRDNRLLMERLSEVEERLAAYEEMESGQFPDSVRFSGMPYLHTPAKVISNSVNRQENFFVVNKGFSDGVSENMAVVSVDGVMAGYVQSCSERYSVCMSVLNRDFRVGGKIKDKEYLGSLLWDGTSDRFVTLTDIPRYAEAEKGDTVLSAYSYRFPPDTFIGTVESARESEDGTYYEIKVRLGLNMSRISDVMLIKYSDSDELIDMAADVFADGPK